VKSVRTLVEYDGETYVVAAEVARRFRISPGTCRNNVLPHLEACYLPGRKYPFYRLSEVKQLSEVRVERKVVEKRPVVLQRSVS
jgi:hypothetical protein